MRLNSATLLGLTILTGWAASAARAQSGAGLLLAPWKEGATAETSAFSILQGQSHTEGSAGSNDIQIWRSEASGRYRFSETNPNRLSVGFDLLQIDIDSDLPTSKAVSSSLSRLPVRLTDQSVAIGVGVYKDGDWEVGLTAGAGYAGNNPYGDGQALYGLGNLIISKKIDENQSLQFLVNYNGNRTFFPDVPLPGVVYHHKLSDTLSYSAGIPFSSIQWKPCADVQVKLAYAIPYTIDVNVDYHLCPKSVLFAGFHERFNAFHIDDRPEHERIFYRARYLEGGLRWEPCEWVTGVIAGGYTIGQEFSTGFDSRDLHDPIEVENAPYVRLGLDLKF